MPNWCNNSLFVIGTKEVVSRFTEAFKGFPAFFKGENKEEYRKRCSEPKECFNALYPVPQDVLERGYDGGIRLGVLGFSQVLNGNAEPPKELDGYHWCIFNWDTKWDVYGKVAVSGLDLLDDLDPEDEVEVVYDFDTAWSPPLKWLEKVAKDFPELEFSIMYYEPGCGFAGERCYKGEQVFTDNQYDRTNDPEGYRRFVTEELGYEDYFEDDEIEQSS
jgi:hypothetical protein